MKKLVLLMTVCVALAGCTPVVSNRGYLENADAEAGVAAGSETEALAAGSLDKNWAADLVHANDWQAALVPAYLAWNAVKIPPILTIHNLAYQGLFPKESLRRIGAPEIHFEAPPSKQVPAEMRRFVDWFNSTSPQSSTQAGIIYNTAGAWVTASTPTAPNQLTMQFVYGTGGVTGSQDLSGSNGAGWQTIAPVPEPGTIGLMAVGLMTVLARRKIRK